MSQSTERKIVNFALFGLGRAGAGIHFPNLVNNIRANILYVVDLDVERLRSVLEEQRATHITAVPYSDCDKVFEDSSVDAVFVCTPTENHEEVCLKALTSKKALLCEKPLSKSVEGIKKIYDLAESNKLPLLCALNRRFDPNVRHISRSLSVSAVGQIHTIRMCSRDAHRTSVEYVKTSGGLFIDSLIHDLDIMCFLMGDFPTQVYATGHCHDPGIAAVNDFDTAVIVLNFSSGIIGSIEFSRNSTYGHEGFLEVFGSDGAIKTKDMRPINVQLDTARGSHLPQVYDNFHSRYFDSYKAMLDHFIDTVQGLKSPEVSRDYVLKLTQLANFCERSARSGQAVKIS